MRKEKQKKLNSSVNIILLTSFCNLNLVMIDPHKPFEFNSWWDPSIILQ